MQHGVFCEWLLSVSMFSRFIYVVACTGSSLIVIAEYFVLWDILHFIYTFIS